jgi:peptide/nickel transport system ATP-binding protein
VLAVKDLRVAFDTEQGRVQALDGVSLTIERGEVVGLVGESGCGKTTLARAVLGILPVPPARILGGEIVFQGCELLRTSPRVMNDEIRGRAITLIPQDPFTSFNPLFPIGTQMMDLMKWKSPRADRRGRRGPALLSRYPRRRYAEDREAVMALLRAVQIPHPEQVLEKYPHTLSGGQRQRLMIAMALLPGPDFVIADEPTTALDVTIQAQILRLLRRLVKERGVSVLFTTHDLGAAHEICDRVVVMYAGQEVERAPVGAFFGAPSHPYTVKLLGSLPDPSREIQDIAGEIPGLIDPPGGCRFHPRCEFADAECRAVRPPVRAIDTDHEVRCYHPVGRDVAPLAPATPTIDTR